MTKNPFINALGAAAYILIIVSGMNFISQQFRNHPDTFMAPVVMLSILTLSVATMGFVFFYQPILLFLENKKKEGVELFVKTLGFFALFTTMGIVGLFLQLFL